MRRRYLLAWMILLLVLPRAGAAGERPSEGNTTRIPTLDDLTESVLLLPDGNGNTMTLRRFHEGTTWEDYQRAVGAEFEVASFDADRRSVSGTCSPTDDDPDGDGLIGAADPHPFLAQRPVVRTEFPIDITPYISVEVVETEEITEESRRFDSSSIERSYNASDTMEIKNVFNSTLGLNLSFGLQGLTPSFNLGSSADFTRTMTRTHTTKWTDSVSRSVKEEFSTTHTNVVKGTYRLVPNAGGVRTNLVVVNDSDPLDGVPTNIEVSEIRLAFAAIHPSTGHVDPIGELTINETFQVFEGPGLDRWTKVVDLSGLNTDAMLRYLRESRVFDISVASFPVAINLDTGEDIRQTLSEINSKTVQYSILYGDPLVNRDWGAVSKFTADGSCLTGRRLLETALGPENVEFERLDSGQLVLKRIFAFSNSGTDYDPAACDADPNAFSRWVWGYGYESNLGQGPLDLESTVLNPQDAVLFYRLTCADLAPEGSIPDFVYQDISVRNDEPAQQQVDDVAGLNEDDRVVLLVENHIETDRVVSQYSGESNVCWHGEYANRVFYDITNYYMQPYQNSLFDDDIPIGDSIDDYGLEVRFDDGNWMSIETLLSVPGVEGEVLTNGDRRLTEELGNYDYAIAFKVIDGLFNNASVGTISFRSNRPPEQHRVGFTGRPNGGAVQDCFYYAPEAYGYVENNIGMQVFRFTADDDSDSFFDALADFDDAQPRRFKVAPEHLDGIDNDGDGVVDDNPLICPARLAAGDAATCRLDDRMGWYDELLATEMQVRVAYENGSYGGWYGFSGPETITVAMPTDPAVAGLEVLTINWAAWPAVSGTNFIEQVDPDPPVVHPVGATLEAEDGLLAYPMVVASADGETFVHVPSDGDLTTGGSVEFVFEVLEEADYEIDARVFATQTSNDSFLVDVLDAQGQRVDFGFGASPAHFRFEAAVPDYDYGDWGWTTVGHRNVYVSPIEDANPAVYRLSPGTYTIRFRLRELDARLDRLRVERICYDLDSDGVTDCAGDCDDNDGQVFPGRGEVCSTAWDDDCDGAVNEGCAGGCGRNCPDIQQSP